MPGSTQTPRVIVVDDDDDTRELLCELFADAGFVAEGYADANTALAATRGVPPAAVLTDLTLPDFSGEELARRIRDALGDSVRLFAMTGRDVESDAAYLFERVLMKPFDFDEIAAIVASAIGQKARSD